MCVCVVCVCHADAVKSKQGAKFSNRIEVEGKNNKRPEITGGYYSTAKLTPNRIHPTPPNARHVFSSRSSDTLLCIRERVHGGNHLSVVTT